MPDTFVDWINLISGLSAAVGLVLTGVGLIFAAAQVRTAHRTVAQANQTAEQARGIAEGQFLLQLDDMFWRHNKVHRLLRPGGAWSPKDSFGNPKDYEAPSNSEEWADAELYMGLFERIRVLMVRGIITDKAVINKLYGYRIANIVSNLEIKQKKLIEEASGWEDFIALAESLGRYQPSVRDRRAGEDD